MGGPEIDLNAYVGIWVDRNGNAFAEGWDARSSSDGEICRWRRVEMRLQNSQPQAAARVSWMKTCLGDGVQERGSVEFPYQLSVVMVLTLGGVGVIRTSGGTRVVGGRSVEVSIEGVAWGVTSFESRAWGGFGEGSSVNLGVRIHRGYLRGEAWDHAETKGFSTISPVRGSIKQSERDMWHRIHSKKLDFSIWIIR